MNNLCKTPVVLLHENEAKQQTHVDGYAAKRRDEFYLQHLKGTVCSLEAPSHKSTKCGTGLRNIVGSNPDFTVDGFNYDKNNNNCSDGLLQGNICKQNGSSKTKKTSSGSSKRRRSNGRKVAIAAPSSIRSSVSKLGRCGFGSTKRSSGDSKIQNLAKRFRSSEYLARSPNLSEKPGFQNDYLGMSETCVMYDDYVVIEKSSEKSYVHYYEKWSNESDKSSPNASLATPDSTLYCYEEAAFDDKSVTGCEFSDIGLAIFAVTSLDKLDIRDVYWQMKAKEYYSHPSTSLCEQKIITQRCRFILVEWLVMVTHHYKIQGETLHLAVNILDRYLEREFVTIRKKYLQLIGITSLLIAAKQLEVEIPPVSACLGLCRNLYTRPQLLSLERVLLITIGFDLNVPSSHLFYDTIISIHYDVYVQKCHVVLVKDEPADVQEYFIALLCLGRSFLEKGLTNYQFVQFPPSVAARAAFRLSTSILDEPASSVGLKVFQDYSWPKYDSRASFNAGSWDGVTITEEELLEYEEENVLSCLHSIRSLYDEAELKSFSRSTAAFVPKYLY
uniref:Cyclin-A2-1 n=1 Tax=Ciona intestinalis TaxID=7719 RepID=F6SAW5_CIOIN|nr:cyclin-A2-1 [Ciona intestinalis]|eukprot:XP_009858971.1 cyclin-A2-1 [Ciona intestinalis]